MDKSKKGMILLAHGARHPDWAAPFQRIQQVLRDRQPDLPVELAFLEFMQPDLFAALEQLVGQGAEAITVVPLFMGQSGHVLRDVPQMVEQARREHPQLSLRLVNAAGEDAGVLEAIASYCLSAAG